MAIRNKHCSLFQAQELMFLGFFMFNKYKKSIYYIYNKIFLLLFLAKHSIIDKLCAHVANKQLISIKGLTTISISSIGRILDK